MAPSRAIEAVRLGWLKLSSIGTSRPLRQTGYGSPTSVHPHLRGLAFPGSDRRPLLKASGCVVDAAPDDHRPCLHALVSAVWKRKPATGLIIHSDQGSQFTSSDWLSLLKQHGMVPSMSGAETAMTTRWLRAFSVHWRKSGSSDGSTRLGTRHARTYSITSRCFTT